MKIRWLIVGAVAAAAGGVLVLKHFMDNKEKLIRYIGNFREKNFSKYPQDNFDSEFAGEDFSA